MKAACSGAIVVFAKQPRPGLVKTRMTPPLSFEEASALYSHMLDDVLEATCSIAQQLALEPVLALHPAEAVPEMSRRVPPGFRVVVQRGQDLSRRMVWAAAEVAAGGASPILLRSSDSPTLGLGDVRAVLDALESSHIAVSPDRDGGYSLIGLRRPLPGLFDHPMSTTNVLEDTLANAHALGIRPCVTEPTFDLDTIEDFEILKAARARGEAEGCPRLLAYLDQNDWWDDRVSR